MIIGSLTKKVLHEFYESISRKHTHPGNTWGIVGFGARFIQDMSAVCASMPMM